jgi:hypothetical protein
MGTMSPDQRGYRPCAVLAQYLSGNPTSQELANSSSDIAVQFRPITSAFGDEGVVLPWYSRESAEAPEAHLFGASGASF